MKILMDVDGVLADFVGSILDATKEISGETIRREDIKEWDFFQELPLSMAGLVRLQETIRSPGFCDTLKVLPGAKDGIAKIKRLGVQVVYVTSPYATSPTWCYERSNWLISHGFAENHKEIIHAVAKQHVTGDAFVDDNPANVRDWKLHNPSGDGIIWRASYNVTAEGVKMTNFRELEQWVRWRMKT